MSSPVRGNTLRITLSVKNDVGTLVDPSTLTLTIQTPSGVETTYTYLSDATVVRDSVGAFHADILLSEIGVWEYKWVTTNPSRTSGEEIYVWGEPTESAPRVASLADYTIMYLGGENWDVLVSSTTFGIARVTLAMETVKRRILLHPPSPSGESALNPNVLAYLGLLTALELIPGTRTAWASKIISRSVGNDPAEITTYTDRAKIIDSLQDDLLRRVVTLKAAADPYLDEELEIKVGIMAIDETNDLKVTEDPRDFPPSYSFPFRRDQVIWWH